MTPAQVGWFVAMAIAGISLSTWGTALVRRLSLQHRLLDVPNERSAHEQPKPTSAGAAIVTTFALGLGTARLTWGEAVVGTGWLPLLVCSVAVAALGLIDDLRNVPAGLRFGVQTVAAALFCAWAEPLRSLLLPGWGEVPFGLAAYPLSVLWLVAVTNFYNFMDGIDGLAAGTAVLVAGAFALILAAAGGAWLPCVILVAANIGFLVHNRPPAKIFMGDVGSGFLGFVLAGLAMMGQVGHAVPLLAFVLPLGMFILDTVITLFRRIIRAERWYAAHRSHYYQRLTAAGRSHAQVDAVELTLTLVFCAAGYLYYATASEGFRVGLVVVVPGLFLVFIAFVRRAERLLSSQAHSKRHGQQTA